MVYEKEPEKTKLDGKFAAIDIGLNNLATVASNEPNFKPFIVCGKAINHAISNIINVKLNYNHFYQKINR